MSSNPLGPIPITVLLSGFYEIKVLLQVNNCENDECLFTSALKISIFACSFSRSILGIQASTTTFRIGKQSASLSMPKLVEAVSDNV